MANNKRNIIIYSLFLLVFIFISLSVIGAPQYTSRVERKDFQKNGFSKEDLWNYVPLTGCVDRCIGFEFRYKCKNINPFFNNCETVCFGSHQNCCGECITEKENWLFSLINFLRF